MEGENMIDRGSATVSDEVQVGPVTPAAQTTKRYLFAVVYAAEVSQCSCAGMDEQQVSTIVEGRLAAVVSGVAGSRIRPERRHVATHQRVLKDLMAATTPLPMKFGILVNSPEAIRKILRRNRRMFLEQLEHVAGKVEFGLRVTWDVPNIFEYFVTTKSELRSARDRLLGANRQPTQEDKIELGRMFDRLLGSEREKHTSAVERILSRAGCESKVNACRKENEGMHLACFVSRQAQDNFGNLVFQAAQRFDNSFAFDYNGPWAPHNFVEAGLEQ